MKPTQLSQPAAPTSTAPGRAGMRAIVQGRYGASPEKVLALRQVTVPAIGADEVWVRVRAAGVDRGTWHLMAGQPYLMRLLGFGLRGPKNRVPGLDLAGTVVAVGAGVTGFRVGDEVFGIGRGAFADYAPARAPAGRGQGSWAVWPRSTCSCLPGGSLRTVPRRPPTTRPSTSVGRSSQPAVMRPSVNRRASGFCADSSRIKR